MKQSSILLVGAGGHAGACVDVIESEGSFRIAGLIDSGINKGVQRFGYPVLGGDEDLFRLRESVKNALICVGQIKTPKPRIRLFEMLRKLGYELPTIVAPTAWISPRACIGMGGIIMHGAIINAGAVIGDNCIINTKALVEHGAHIGNNCHVSTGALVNGDVFVGAGTFIGSGSMLKEGVQLGQNCIVGLGARVYVNLLDGEILTRSEGGAKNEG